MTRHSVPDRLPSPDDYQQPADSPSAFQALADAAQAALTGLRTRIDGLTSWKDVDFSAWGNGVIARLGALEGWQPGVDSAIAARAMIEQDGTQTTDWDTAILGNVSYWSLPGAAHQPSAVISDAHWRGYAVPHTQDWVLQFCWPFASPDPGVSPTMGFVRFKTPSGWSAWSRTGAYLHTYAHLDAFINYRLANVQRFAAGLKNAGAGGVPTAGDTYRIQCYDTAGNFTWTALEINQEGQVRMPRTQAARRAPLPPDHVATLGDVIEVVAAAVGVDAEAVRRIVAGKVGG